LFIFYINFSLLEMPPPPYPGPPSGAHMDSTAPPQPYQTK